MLGIALIGCGRQGRAHLAALPLTRMVELRAVCDIVPGVAASVAPRGVPADENVARTLARDEVDAVVVAASTNRHDEIVTAALAAGKHVLCEKPLTLDPESGSRLDALAQAHGLALHVGFVRRHGWPYLEALRLLREGAIGEPRLARLAQWDASPPPPSFLDPRVSGGLELDCGIHEVDLAMWLLDSPIAEVAARGAPTRAEIADVDDVEAAACLARTAAGHAVTIDLHRSCAFGDVIRAEIAGSAGALIMSFTGPGSLEVGTSAGLRSESSPVVNAIESALAAQLDALADAAAGAQVDAPGPSDSARAVIAATAMRRARESGRWEPTGL